MCIRDRDTFKDRIDGWIIDKLKSIGCDTVKSVLELSVAELAQRSDLEEETAQEIIDILKSEEEDVSLDEFKDEIDEAIIDKFKSCLLYTSSAHPFYGLPESPYGTKLPIYRAFWSENHNPDRHKCVLCGRSGTSRSNAG